MEELILGLNKECKVVRASFFNESEMFTRFLKERQINYPQLSYTYKPYMSFPLMPLPPIASTFDSAILKNFSL
jgi:hypothetical protein